MSWQPTQFSSMLVDTSDSAVFKKVPFAYTAVRPIAGQASMHLLTSLVPNAYRIPLGSRFGR
jgi:hypothetical protein